MTSHNAIPASPTTHTTLGGMIEALAGEKTHGSEGMCVRWTCDDASAALPAATVWQIVSQALEAACSIVTTTMQEPDQGEISVALCVVGSRLHVIIEDTAWRHGAGPGPWARAIERTTGRQARALGGTVWLAAVPYGAGGVVKYELPLNRVAA